MFALALSQIIVEVALIAGTIWPDKFTKSFSLPLLELPYVHESRGPLEAAPAAPGLVFSHIAVVGDACLVLDGSEEGLEAAGAGAAARSSGRGSCTPLCRWFGRNGPGSPSGPRVSF